jgi:serine/threonine protein kinase
MEKSIQAIVAASASFLFMTILFAMLFVVCKLNKKSCDRTQAGGRVQARGRVQAGVRVQARALPNPPKTELSSIAVDESASFDPSLRISMNELVNATKNFSADLIVGDGSFGLVYRAQLSNGTTVAIKRLDPDAFQGFREFRAEMETLGKVQHRNIVKILGYCVSGPDRLLVYEYVEKGSLDQWLQDASSENDDMAALSQWGVRKPLCWETRIKIVKGVASALAYCHGLEKPIIHRDIKASNVLLDSNFEAHIADFGLARSIDSSHSHVSTQVAGTMGYMPPEYKEGLTAATVKADVYSFGILMLEIATGKRPNLPTVMDGKQVLLVEWAKRMVAQNRQMEMVDANIWREGLVEANVKEYFAIAGRCTVESSRDRPVMAQVVESLDLIPG